MIKYDLQKQSSYGEDSAVVARLTLMKLLKMMGGISNSNMQVVINGRRVCTSGQWVIILMS